jgi:hypothetical protein
MCSDIPDFSVQKLSTLYDISTGPAGLTDVSTQILLCDAPMYTLWLLAFGVLTVGYR